MTTSTNTIAIINSKAPFSCTSGKEALDIALIYGSFEQPIALFFQGDGVYQLIKNQNGTLISAKDYLKTFSAFEFYDIEKVYVCQSSLKQRGLENTFHIDNVLVLSQHEFAETLASYKTKLRF